MNIRTAVLVLLVMLAVSGALVVFLLRNPGQTGYLGVVTPAADGRSGSVLFCAASGEPRVASVRVTGTTELIDQRRRPNAVQFNALAPGQRVEIWTTGVVAESFPPQMQATRVAIVANGQPGDPPCAAP
jgi:hypothetical protein